jgi:acylphosphatase
MDRKGSNSQAFVLRVWTEEKAGHKTLRGWVQHARTGEVAYVQGTEDLISFLERWVGASGEENGDDLPTGDP